MENADAITPTARLQELFSEVVDLSAEARADYLWQACKGSPELQRRVERLVEAYADGDTSVRELLENLPLAPYPPAPEGGRSEADILPTETVVGHYRIMDIIGIGGMGVVYRAFDTELDRLVALKALPQELSGEPEARTRFIREARAASALEHENICTVYEVVESDDGKLFIAMGYYDGETLAEKIHRGPLPVTEALDYSIQVVEALSAAHAAGIVHRDVKPANIIITPRGIVKLVDFGLAKAVGSASLTAPGTTPGTIAYMSPEQTRGEEADERSDVWSTGVVIYESLTGKKPFRGENSDVIIYSIRNDEPEPIRTLRPEVPAWLSRAVQRTLQKDRAHRYDSATELLSELRSRRTATWTMDIGSSGLGAKEPAAIALLPLSDVTGTPGQEWFTEGVTDALITDLAKIRGLRVISRGSAMRFKNTKQTPPEIAAQLGVEYVVEGSVGRSNGDVKVSIRLIDARRDEYVWAESYEREFRNILGLQGEIAQTVAGQIRIELTPQERNLLEVERRVEPETYELYLKGMYHLQKFTPDGIEKGLSYLHRTAEREPGEPLVHAGLALGYSLIAHTPAPPPDANEKAMAELDRALRLDENLAEAQLTLAMLKIYGDWDKPGADAAYRAALRISPSLAMARAHYGWLLELQGNVEGGLSEMRQAQLLDPLAPIYPAWQGQMFCIEGYFDEGIIEAQKALELNPDFPVAWYVLGWCYAEKGMYDEGIAASRRSAEAGPDYRFGVAQSLAMAGRNEEAREIVREIESQPTVWDSYGLAQVYKSLGETDRVFHWLEVGCRQRHAYIQWYQRPGNFRYLSRDPRYNDLARRLSLPEADSEV